MLMVAFAALWKLQLKTWLERKDYMHVNQQMSINVEEWETV